MLTAVDWEGVFHVSFVEAVVVFGEGAAVELGGGQAVAAIPLRSATSAMMSRIIRLRSQSLGV